MYCQNCGQKIPEEAKFCPNCGQEINNYQKSKEKQSTGIDADELVDTSVTFVKKGASEFKDNWSTWSSGRKFFSILVCCCVGWIIIGGIMGALTPDKNAELFDQTNEGKDITLIKESTDGEAYYSSGKPIYDYSVSGVFKNIPKDSTGFTVQGTFFDESDKEVGSAEMDLDYFEYYTENSDPTEIVNLQTHELVNVSKVEIEILNPDGEVVFEKTVDYDMDKFDLSDLDDEPEADENNETEDINEDWDSNYDSFSDDSSDDYSTSSSSSSSGITYVASQNSDKFHYPSCSAANRIKDSNKITFSSREDAVSRGYSPCGICLP